MEECKGPERRSTPRGGEITDEQVRSALGRVITEAEFTEGDIMRERIRGLILPAGTETIDSDSPAKPTPATPAATAQKGPEILIPQTSLDAQAKKYVENLVGHKEYGYTLAHKEITDGGLYNPEEEGIVKAPTAEEAVAILQQQLTPQEVEAIKRYIRVPGLALKPENLPWQKFVKNLDTGTRNRRDTFISDGRKVEFDRQDAALGIQETSRITGWQVGVAEMEKELNDQSGLLKGIIQRWLGSDEAKILQLADPKLYALLQKGALLSGDKNPLDKTGWSILQRADKPEEGESPIIGPDGLVSGGGYGWRNWGGDRVSFVERDPDVYCRGARLRLAVIKNA